MAPRPIAMSQGPSSDIRNAADAHGEFSFRLPHCWGSAGSALGLMVLALIRWVLGRSQGPRCRVHAAHTTAVLPRPQHGSCAAPTTPLRFPHHAASDGAG